MRPLAISLGIALVILVAEVVGGLVTNSLALLADAGHVATDAMALVLALVASWLALRPATPYRTFGYRRAGVIAAAINAVALLFVAFFITWEAIGRIGDPPQVESGGMLAIAAIGLVANLVMLLILNRSGSHDHDLNVRAAALHVAGDLLGSVGAIVAALIMLWTGWYLADPILSVVVSLVLVRGALSVLHDGLQVLLDAAPAEMDPSAVRRDLSGVEGVRGLHDLHVWSIAPGKVALMAHVDVTGERPWRDVLHEMTSVLREDHGITHVTLQPEGPGTNASADCTYPGCCLDAPAAPKGHTHQPTDPHIQPSAS
jgi:cobalt-zinc-cadmium efflux system protein